MAKTPTPAWFTSGWEHIWLPYAQMQTTPAQLPVNSAKGCTIELEDGRKLLDGISSWWSMCHGYQHPHIVEAVKKQADTLSHVMFAGLAHEPAFRLAERLAKLAPEGLERVFFSDSGSTAVEVALKMALQYWKNQGKPKKNKFICFTGAYHGDTFGAMSVSQRGGMHSAFDNLLIKQYVLDLPSDEYSFAEFETLVKDISNSVAGLTIEPLLQGAGGMRFFSADVLAEIRRVCRENDILFIADEIATGFYRTGTRFACEEAGISPDILCIGKALTGGTMTLAATLAQKTVFDGFLGDELEKALMHGPTYMANPLACAAAHASLDLFEKENYHQKVEAIETQMAEHLLPLETKPGVVDVRVRGAVGVVQLDPAAMDMFALRAQAVELGVWLRPFHDVIYIMPPLVITPSELQILLDAVASMVASLPSSTSAKG